MELVERLRVHSVTATAAVVETTGSQTFEELTTVVQHCENEKADALHMLLAGDIEGMNDEGRLGCLRSLVHAASVCRVTEDSPEKPLLQELFETTISCLSKDLNTLSNGRDFAEQVVSIWSLHLASLADQTIAEALETLLDLAIHEKHRAPACGAPLIASLLCRISNAGMVELTGGGGGGAAKQRCSGPTATDMLIDRLTGARVQPDLVVPLLTAFHGITLTNDQLVKLVDQWIRCIDEVQPDELPTLVYQLALYATKAPRLPVIPGILAAFSRNDQRSKTSDGKAHSLDEAAIQARARIEGTVIFHLCFTLGQDKTLCEALIKSVKADYNTLISPFTLSCLLTLARNYRYTDQILDLLSSLLVTSARDSLRLSGAPWLAAYAELRAIPLFSLLRNVVSRTTQGADRAIQPMVQLLVTTIDQCSPNHGEAGARATKKEDSQHMLAQDATQLLAYVFERCESTRETLLDTIFEHLALHADSADVYVGVLDLVAKESCAALLERSHKIKEIVSLLPTMKTRTAMRLLHALSPLLDASRQLLDNLLLLARKCLFSRDAIGRENALHALSTVALLDLTCLDEGGGCSERADAYRREVIGMIARTTYQSAYSRATAYEHLCALASIHPVGIQSLASHLLAQAEEWVDLNREQGSPVRLDLLVRGSFEQAAMTHTAFPQLLLLLERCVMLSQKGGEHITGFLRRVVSRLASTSLSEYELARKSLGFDMEAEQRRVAMVRCLIELYEAALAIAMAEDDRSTCVELLRALFSRHCQAHLLLREKPGVSGSCTCQIRDIILPSPAAKELCTLMRHADDSALQFGYRVHVLRVLIAVAVRESEGSSNVVVCANGLLAILKSIAAYSAPPYAPMTELFRLLGVSDTDQPTSEPAADMVLDALMERGVSLQKDAAAILDAMAYIQRLCIPNNVAHHAEWLRDLATTQHIEESALARTLTSALLNAELGFVTLPNHLSVVQDIRLACGSIGLPDEMLEPDDEMRLGLIGQRTTRTVFRALLDTLDASIEELAHCVSRWYRVKRTQGHSPIVTAESMDYVVRRMCALCQVCVVLERTCVAGPMAERLVPTLQRVYKLLGAITRKASQLGVRPSEAFYALIEQAGGPLSRHLYLLIPYIQQNDATHAVAAREDDKKQKNPKDDMPAVKKASCSARIAREQRAIPGLIFTVEQFEKYVIALSKQSKVDLVGLLKRSTARDFRIQVQHIAVSEDEEEEEAEEEQEQEENNQAAVDMDVEERTRESGAEDSN
ncbi:FANCI solenoid 4-domain-containing protein [Thamnocephalis sphaerospora]|uniref:FANCI solenoid 4-domain-containing protein n=1 Tax=Thamnocephalis sphaerospora TaxID=78915 RepID=A0A4P9XZU4_9FUNG|nr:FANCI solenoid 4-domain-containing protein [Thamnocephalis sphaerospora]|eukprot:RKP11010.1 FANCI solenoid 4-domain-containing protein [Thamnocephalis sphaerospora]